MSNAGRSALVVTIDRWGAGYLGPYGNAWLETPALNRLAAESLVCENVFADSTSLDLYFRSVWTGRHAAASQPGPGPAPVGLPAALAALDVGSELITDDATAAEHEAGEGFTAKRWVESASPTRAARDAADMQFAALIATAIERLADPTPRLLWVHSRGLGAGWDAPREFREQFRDEDDPESLDDIAPPDRRTGPGDDPDELLRWVHAYAGQAAAFDLCLEALFDAFRDSTFAGPESLLLFTSPRGLSLGEHGRLGACDDPFYEETLHVPLLLRHGGGAGALSRAAAVVQPPDVDSTLRDWFGAPLDARPAARSLLGLLDDDPTFERAPALAISAAERALRTPNWFWRERGESRELFAKPDDRWEVNELSRRCPEIVERMGALADRRQVEVEAGRAEPPGVVDDDLWSGVR